MATSLIIQGIAQAQAPTFSSSTGNITGRPCTAAAGAWSPPPGTVIGAPGPNEKTARLFIEYN